jgi:hypothetical protein
MRVGEKDVPAPENEKLLAAKAKGLVGIGGVLPDFYDFLKARGIVLAEEQIVHVHGEPRLRPHRYDHDPNQLIADFLGIDQQARNDELLEILRALGNENV